MPSSAVLKGPTMGLVPKQESLLIIAVLTFSLKAADR